jgi:cation diffusion facilitator family transporter
MSAGSQRYEAVRRILWAVGVLNLAVAAAKLTVGWLVGSISMVADGFHSVTDAAANAVGLVGLAVSRRPPDETHPYGHRKFETLSALGIGALLALTAWEVLRSCLERLREGGTPDVQPVAFWVMAGTMLINLAVSRYEARRGRQLGSRLLAADSEHTHSDVLVSLAVLVALIAARWGWPQLDVLAAVAITVAIGRAAWRIVLRSADHLLDAAVVSADRVREVALSVPMVLSAHKIRTRGDHDSAHADLHIQVAADLAIDRAHVLGHMVAHRLEEELGLTDVVVHVEPPVGHATSWLPAEEEDDRA